MLTLIDCDGVIANFDKMFYTVLKDEFNIDFDADQDQQWDYFNHPQVKAIKNDVWKYILGTKGLIRGLEQYDYTQEFLAKLREIGDVECVTSVVSGGYYADERIMWLIEEAGFERYDIHLSYKKHRIKGDVFIDDKPDNVVKWADAWITDPIWGWDDFPPSHLPVPVLWQSPGRPRLEVDERILPASDIDFVIGYLRDVGKIG
jgi:5'(3')-deoxyribonucleotidase